MTNATETNTIEYKREYSDTILKDVIGFLNSSLGGHLYVGIENDGSVYGVENADELQLKIINILRDSIKPYSLGLFDVFTETKEGKSIIHIIVSSGNEKPYYIASKGMTPNGCYLRVGSSSQQMTENQIAELYAKRTRNTLKNIVSYHQDLTFEQLKIYYQERGLTLNDNFARNLELLTDDGKYNYIAYLLADKNGTSIKVAKYWGKDKLKLRELKEYGYCSLIKATKSVLDRLDVENTVSTKVTYTERKEKTLWNTDAVKEAVINFIVHNDYTREVPPLFEIFSDRLEITSYGGLPEGLSKEEFFSGVSMPRNRELMRIFKDLDLVEHIGSGMGKIMTVYNKDNFEFMEHFLRIRIPFEKGYEDDYTELNKKSSEKKSKGSEKSSEKNEKSREKILAIISKNPTISANDISKEIGISSRAVEKHIKSLKDNNKIKRVGADKGGHWEVI